MGSQRVRHNWATFTSLRFSALNWHLFYWMGSLGGASVKECAYPCRRLKRHGFDPWVRKIPWDRKWYPTSEFLPGKFDRQRSMGATVHGATRNWTLLSDWSNTHTHRHTHTQLKRRKWCWSSKMCWTRKGREEMRETWGRGRTGEKWVIK